VQSSLDIAPSWHKDCPSSSSLPRRRKHRTSRSSKPRHPNCHCQFPEITQKKWNGIGVNWIHSWSSNFSNLQLSGIRLRPTEAASAISWWSGDWESTTQQEMVVEWLDGCFIGFCWTLPPNTSKGGFWWDLNGDFRGISWKYHGISYLSKARGSTIPSTINGWDSNCQSIW
jgi:hypothetical protein